MTFYLAFIEHYRVWNSISDFFFYLFPVRTVCPLIVALSFKAMVAYARWNVYEPLVIPRVSAVKRQDVIENNFHGKFCVVRCGMTRKASPSHSCVMVARIKLTSAPALNDKALFSHPFYLAWSNIFIRCFHECANDRFILSNCTVLLCKSNLTHQLAVPSEPSLKFRRNTWSHFSRMARDIEFYFNRSFF